MKQKNKWLAGLLCAAMILSASPLQSHAEEETAAAKENAYTRRQSGYQQYLNNGESVPFGAEAIALDLTTLQQGEQNPEILTEYEGRQAPSLAFTAKEQTAALTVSVPAEARYQIEVTYYTVAGKDRPVDIGLQIDGAYPFHQAEILHLPRVYVNETDEALYDGNQNQYTPRQVEKQGWYTVRLANPDGDNDDPLAFLLKAGEHILTIISSEQSVVIGEIRLCPPENILTYDKYKSAHGENKGGNEYIIIEGEQAHRKSDQSLRPLTDRTSPATSPMSSAQIRLNMIGQQYWQSPGQWLEWDFTAPADGWYQMDFRYMQSYLNGFFTNRRILIDGQVPFEEANAMRFQDCYKWDKATLSDENGQACPVYLTKGEHTLRMEVVLGDMAETFVTLGDLVYDLNELYRSILMITGANADKYRDYNLEKEIPGLMEEIERCADVLAAETERIRQVTQTNSGAASVLGILERQLRDMMKNPQTIALRLDSLKGNIGSLSAWALDIRNQPLDLDYIRFSQAGAVKYKYNAHFFEQFWYNCKAFFDSFFTDYNSLGNTSGQKSITLWVNTGRDQAQIMDRMISDLFTPKTNIAVHIKLINASTVEAFLSGQAPDVSLMMGRDQPVNLAIRGALLDLTQFDDFKETKETFMPTAVLPYEFEDGCYGLPDTQSFDMLFYRTDIFNSMDITPPDTWEELYRLIPKMQRYNMEVGLPYTSLYPALLMQRGGTYYNDDLSRTDLGSEVALEAFRQWTSLYREHGLPLTYDFYNRFRTGEMPVAVAPYTEFTRLVYSAPEIRGLWEMVPLPGTVQKDGKLSRVSAGGGTAGVILSNTKNPQEAWSFLKWWVGSEAQARYARDTEAQMGIVARVPVSNKEAFASLSWTNGQYKNIYSQWEEIRELPEVPGGYYMSRGLDNAFKEAVLSGRNPKEALGVWNKQINDEIKRKREEFGLE